MTRLARVRGLASAKAEAQGLPTETLCPPASVFCADEGQTRAIMAALDDLKTYYAKLVASSDDLLSGDA